MMRHLTPAFWEKTSALSMLLTPLALLYRLAFLLRQWMVTPVALPVPVICVGNLTVGGAGKTPVVIAIASYLKECGVAVHVVSRGYGGSLPGPVRVDIQRHAFHEVGDEPLLIARHAPCWVGKDRVSTARTAVNAGAQVIVLDDGLQNPSLKKDLSLIVVDAGYGFGNGKLLPAGPLREPVSAGLRRAQGIIFIGNARTHPDSLPPTSLPIIHANLALTGTRVLEKKRAVAFAGIGRPQKFYETLRQAGYDLAATHDFPDHHPYTSLEMEALAAEAGRLQAVLLTTEKDWVRVPQAFQSSVNTAPAALLFENLHLLTNLLATLNISLKNSLSRAMS